jgi:hypothetical protein
MEGMEPPEVGLVDLLQQLWPLMDAGMKRAVRAASTTLLHEADRITSGLLECSPRTGEEAGRLRRLCVRLPGLRHLELRTMQGVDAVLSEEDGSMRHPAPLCPNLISMAIHLHHVRERGEGSAPERDLGLHVHSQTVIPGPCAHVGRCRQAHT